MSIRAVSWLALVVGVWPALAATAHHPLTFQDRVAAQRAIEQVYWSHRIWPKENPGAKPPLSAVMSDDTIRAKVETYLRESSALARLWHRPIKGEQLQAELDRMAAGSHDPAMLREIYAALGNDPAVIAETLARQTLTDRLVRSWYATDDRFHDGVRQRAEAAVAACASAGCMKSMGGRYVETTWKRGAAAKGSASSAERGIVVDGGAWDELLARWARKLGGGRDSIPLMKLSRLDETADRLIVSAVLKKSDDVLVIAAVTWDKKPFEDWWETAAPSFDTSLAAPVHPYVLAEAPAADCTPDTWAPTSLELETRSDHTAVWTGSEMIVWGGSGDATQLNSGARYNPSTDSWLMTTKSGVPRARYGHTAVWTGTEMIVRGGESSSPFDDGGRYDPMTDSWRPTSIAGDQPQARRDHTAVWTGTRMIIWGGYWSPGNEKLDSGARYDPSTDSWQAISSAGTPDGRYFHTAVWTGSRMIVWGGVGADSSAALNSGGRYDPGTDTWQPTSIGAGTPTGVFGHTAVWAGNSMIVWGGTPSSVPTNSGARYDPVADAWTPTSFGSKAPTPRLSHSAVWTGSEMIVWGGDGNPSGTYLGSGGRYNPVTDTWSTTSSHNAPSARSGHTAVWTGTEMIAWGGTSNQGTFNSGARYAPASDSWIATSVPVTNEPEARESHSGVWTGSEMIVWGGLVHDGSALGSGGRYTPATSSWRPTASGSSPAARWNHTAVWTGTEMIVWGGYNGTADLSTGGRYDPAGDSWRATAKNGANVPTPRTIHLAVWTGNVMVIWGGQDASGYVSTGARYGPSSDSWLPVSAVNAPAPRTGATGVWTGSEMVVWGGRDTTWFNSGGRYNPSTDSWRATSVGANVPTARSDHSAVWTGSRMIVWGGTDNYPGYGTILDTGGLYDPVGDTWTPTSTVGGTLTGRTSHSAVWSGTEMLVWSGNDGTSLVNTGDRYNPSNDAWRPIATDSNDPVARTGHTALWTGSEMIVWGGDPGTVSESGPFVLTAGGRYCADHCAVPATLYQDLDGDGFGNASVSQVTCAAPAGWVSVAGDCDDTNPAVHPGAPEINDGIDNQCPGDPGYGLVDELGDSGSVAADKVTFSWAVQQNATSYQLARSTAPDFTSACTSFNGPSPTFQDAETPSPGTPFYYIARATAPFVGSWGKTSAGIERTTSCP
jgi:N-acetylneuraminic acid mutarotase